jgi:PEP-CTERM motif
MPSTAPVILFGAFDRHNLGDMLFPHVLAALLAPRPVVFAGLVERDLRPWGGQRVEALPKLAEAWSDRPAHLIHVGGDLLTCNTFEAAVMVQPPEEAERIIARYESSPEAGMGWAKSYLGIDRQAAYVVPRAQFKRPGRHYFVAFEDLPFPGSDGDFNDMVLELHNVLDAPAVPEPVTLSLLGVGLATLMWSRRKPA